MKLTSVKSKASHFGASHLLLLLVSMTLSGITAASLRDHRLRGAASDAPDQDMLKALQYIQSLRQSAKDQQDFERSTVDGQSDEPRLERQEDKSEELLQAVLSTLQQTENPGDQSAKTKDQAVSPHQQLPLMFEDDQGEERSEDVDRGDTFKRTNENVEEKYTPQTLATLQSVFDELGKVTRFNSKRETGEEEDEDFMNARDLAYEEGDWGQTEAEEEREEVARALDYLEANDRENDESLLSKRSDDDNEGEMANLADFYLLKVLEQTEEEEQKKRQLEEEEEAEEEERMERAAEFRNTIDPKLIYRLLQISQKYQIPPEDLIDMLRSGERIRIAPVYAKKTYKKPQYYSRRLPSRQKTPDELRTERILKILGLPGDENNSQVSSRKQYKNIYARPTWSQGSVIAKPQQPKIQLKGDYDDTENELATFLAARMLSKYPTYKSKSSQKRDDDDGEEEEEEEEESFDRAVQDYFDQLDSSRNEKRQSEAEERGAEDFGDEDVMKLLNFVHPEEQDAKNTE